MEFSEEVFGQRIRKLRQDMGISMQLQMPWSWTLRSCSSWRISGCRFPIRRSWSITG